MGSFNFPNLGKKIQCKNMKELFLAISRFYLNKINKSKKIRDFLIWPIASRVLGKSYDKFINLKIGLKMKTDLKDILGRFILFYGPYQEYFWEPQTMKLMKKLIKDANNVIIAGAHIGYVALMARLFMEKGMVYAFEPVQYLYHISKENFEANKDLGRIVLNQMALSDKNGEQEIYINNIRSTLIKKDDSNNLAKETVKTITIDTFMQRENITDLDFILLDIEGYEFRILKSMKKLFDNKVLPDIIFEYSPFIKNSMQEAFNICRYLERYGYKIFIIEDDYNQEDVINRKSKSIIVFDWEKVLTAFSKERSFNMLATTDYNNEISQYLKFYPQLI